MRRTKVFFEAKVTLVQPDGCQPGGAILSQAELTLVDKMLQLSSRRDTSIGRHRLACGGRSRTWSAPGESWSASLHGLRRQKGDDRGTLESERQIAAIAQQRHFEEVKAVDKWY